MAIPRTFRTFAITALGLFFLTFVYLSSTSHRDKLARLIGHNHALNEVEDIGLIFPLDPVPRQDFASLAQYPPQNIHEPSKFAFATFYCTRQPDTRGPYFEATQSIIWRILWSDYRSKYPVIVFVCPFIPEENRRIFRGQGAIVKEIDLLDDIIPDEAVKTKRWIDVLSKLNLWKEVEWERMVFLDSDAFPVKNIDDIFEVVPMQRCKEDALTSEDKAVVDNGAGDMCNYVFAAVPQFTTINAGMMVLKPDLDMHAKLISAARKTNDYDITDMEQGVLKSKNAFASDGPFPVNKMPTIWNADPFYYKRYREGEPEVIKEGPIRVLHVKAWHRWWGEAANLTDVNDMWDLDWMKMCRFFDGEGFVEARQSGVYKTPYERYIAKHPEAAAEEALAKAAESEPAA